MFWLRNANAYVIDVSSVRDVRGEPLVWGPAGTSASYRVLNVVALQSAHVARQIEGGHVLPSPEYDAAHTGRPLEAVRAEYAKVFGAGTVTVPAAVAPAHVSTPAPAVEVAPVAAPVDPPIEPEPDVEAPADVAADAAVEAEIEIPAEAPGDSTADTSAKKKQRR